MLFLQGVLRELEQKKPQLDELLHTAESLKGTENRQQLHGKGKSCYFIPYHRGSELIKLKKSFEVFL